jgi:hypothetical protein
MGNPYINAHTFTPRNFYKPFNINTPFNQSTKSQEVRGIEKHLDQDQQNLLKATGKSEITKISAVSVIIISFMFGLAQMNWEGTYIEGNIIEEELDFKDLNNATDGHYKITVREEKRDQGSDRSIREIFFPEKGFDIKYVDEEFDVGDKVGVSYIQRNNRNEAIRIKNE